MPSVVGYFAKIPLVDGKFFYPITSISISIIDREITKEYSGQYPDIVEFDVVRETVIRTIDNLVEGSHYELDGGVTFTLRNRSTNFVILARQYLTQLTKIPTLSTGYKLISKE